jgi:hypothetical protein
MLAAVAAAALVMGGVLGTAVSMGSKGEEMGAQRAEPVVEVRSVQKDDRSRD